MCAEVVVVVVVVAKIVVFQGPPRKAQDWQRLAAAAGDPSAAALLYYVCNQTKWRRALGKAKSSHSGFAATGEEGAILGPLGMDLAAATVNMVAAAQHARVNRW